MNFNNLSIEKKTILEVDKKILFKFYKKNYFKKFLFLKKNWKWLYRTNFSKKIQPIVLLKKKDIISHSGCIPFNIKINKRNYSASWFVDFLVIQKYRKLKLGSNIAEIWMKNPDIGVTFCNDISLKIFKKHNWTVKNIFFTLLIPLKPFNHTKLHNFFINSLSNLLNKYFFYLFSKFNKLNETKYKNVTFEYLSKRNFNQLYNITQSNKNFPTRDQKYLEWRVLKSPFKKSYMIISIKNKKYYFLAKENNKKRVKFLEILIKPQIINLVDFKKSLLSISHWAFTQNYTYIKLLIDKKSMKDLNLFFVLKKKLNFAFYTKKKLKKINFQFDLIDSDFEFTSK